MSVLNAGLSVDEYLHRCFDPECELLGGDTRPKPVGTIEHSRMENRLTRLLERLFAEGRVLIPDVVVPGSDSPSMHRGVLNEPPLLRIEILCPSRRSAEMLAKPGRYREFGVPFCWVINPVGCKAWESCLDRPGAVGSGRDVLGPLRA